MWPHWLQFFGRIRVGNQVVLNSVGLKLPLSRYPCEVDKICLSCMNCWHWLLRSAKSTPLEGSGAVAISFFSTDNKQFEQQLPNHCTLQNCVLVAPTNVPTPSSLISLSVPSSTSGTLMDEDCCVGEVLQQRLQSSFGKFRKVRVPPCSRWTVLAHRSSDRAVLFSLSMVWEKTF